MKRTTKLKFRFDFSGDDADVKRSGLRTKIATFLQGESGKSGVTYTNFRMPTQDDGYTTVDIQIDSDETYSNVALETRIYSALTGGNFPEYVEGSLASLSRLTADSPVVENEVPED